VDPNEVLSEYMQEVDALARKADEAKKQLKALTGSLTSKDGAVTLTVNAAGALQSLSFGQQAEQMPKQRLAQLILSTARSAQLQAAQQVTSILAPIVGENSDAMRFVQEQIPVPEEPEESPETSDPQQQGFDYQAQQPQGFGHPIAPQPHQQPQPQPGRRPQPRREVDDDYGASPVTREEDW
jgi:DNA-binding protein YbaB